MQYKKNEVKNKLIEAGEEEFFLYGYNHSSIRGIVKTAGTTIGNFYNYFTNKEELFKEVVNDTLQMFYEFITGHEEDENLESLFENNDISQWRRLLEENSASYLHVFTKRFYILMTGSEGTSYSGTREIIHQYIMQHFLGHVFATGSNIPSALETANVLSYEFLEGLLYIIKNYSESDTVKTLMTNHMFFFFLGTMGMLGDMKGSRSDD